VVLTGACDHIKEKYIKNILKIRYL